MKEVNRSARFNRRVDLSLPGKETKGLGLAVIAFLLVTLFASCGGGAGGGGMVTIQGLVKRSDTRGLPDTGTSVTIAGKTAQVVQVRQNADGLDYNFEVVGVPSTATEATINPPQGSSDAAVTFPLPPLPSSGTVYIGEVFIGPNTGIARATGRVLSAEERRPVDKAKVTIGAFSTLTNQMGSFVFDRLVAQTDKGTVEASGFEKKVFVIDPPLAPGDNDLGTILIAPPQSNEPPGGPYNLHGTVTLQGGGSPVGVSVQLLDAEGAQVDSMVITQPGGEFRFWVPPGEYLLKATYPGFRGQKEVILTASNQLLKVDITLIPE